MINTGDVHENVIAFAWGLFIQPSRLWTLRLRATRRAMNGAATVDLILDYVGWLRPGRIRINHSQHFLQLTRPIHTAVIECSWKDIKFMINNSSTTDST